jgi:hypothetical protein
MAGRECGRIRLGLVMANSWDVFFSYRRHDLERARPLLDALAEAGIRVWRDEREIPGQGSISSAIRGSIASCKALLAFYSRTYPLSNPCQQEITLAWLAAEQIGPAANRRVWIVNPEDRLEHIPELLRDQQIPRVTGDSPECAVIAETLKRGLDALDATLLGGGMRELPVFHGMSAIQTGRFTGRVAELWNLHGQLTANRISIITGVYGQAAAQVRGLGGNGKSLLAREYSIRFGPAYPGGVFWLNAYGEDGTKGSVNAEQRDALRQDQIREFAVQVGAPAEGLKPGEIEAGFWHEMETRGEPCLWIVDDVPSGLAAAEFERWNAQRPNASTLVTTRSKEYGELGGTLDLGVLSPGEALGLLCSYRKPASGAEETAARQIVELLGYHPLAVAVAGGYLAQELENFQSYAEALENPREDAVEFGNLLEESLPTGHERSISATLLKSIRQLGPEGLDFLRLASVMAVAPIPVGFVAEVFELLDGAEASRARALKALSQTEALSLCERSGDEARAVHTLVSRTIRFRFPGEQRAHELRFAAINALARRLAAVSHIGEHSRIALDIPHARYLVKSVLQSTEEAALAIWLAHRDYERADYSSARKLHEQVVAAYRRLVGEEHQDTLAAMNNLAQTMQDQGELPGAR